MRFAVAFSLPDDLFKLDKPYFFVHFTHCALGTAAGFNGSPAQDFF